MSTVTYFLSVVTLAFGLSYLTLGASWNVSLGACLVGITILNIAFDLTKQKR